MLISMEAPTKRMLKEAAEVGFYKPPGLLDNIRASDFTIEELLEGNQVAHPRPPDATFKKASRSRSPAEKKLPLPFEGPIQAGAEEEGNDGSEEPF